MKTNLTFLFVIISIVLAGCGHLKGTGDLAVVVEREKGQVIIAEHSSDKILTTVSGLGDLSHASVVYSRDARFAFVFGRDGGLTKIDLLKGRIVKRIIQAGNSIGGAISQDGKIVAVSNYTPGGVKLFDSETLSFLYEIPAIGQNGVRSKVVGLVDAPENKFVFSLFDAGEIWTLEANSKVLNKYQNIGKMPYDALITPDGRFYIAGLFGEKGIAVLDLWNPKKGVQKKLLNYGRNDQNLPVYKMPHLEGWAQAGQRLFLPAIGQHQLLIVDEQNWKLEKSIPVKSQIVFAMAQPDNKKIWINFAFPDNQYLQVFDVISQRIEKTFDLGKGVLHMEFSPRGEKLWVSVRDQNKVVVIDTYSLDIKSELPADRPSGIFFSSRAHKIGL